jgi:hypothetical protein
MQTLIANPRTEPGDPSGRARRRTEGAEGACNPIRKNNINSLDHPEFPGTKLPTKENTQRESQVSRYMCSRGCPYLISMGGDRGLIPQLKGTLEPR